jgi:sec-independent protein translocase protein TatC
MVDTPLLGAALALTVVILVGNLIALCYWARAEATARGVSTLWTFVMLTSGFGLIYYVWVRYIRNDWTARTRPADRRERFVTAYSVGVLLAFVVGAFVTPPDPFTQLLTFPALFVGSFLLSLLLVMRDGVPDSADAIV